MPTEQATGSRVTSCAWCGQPLDGAAEHLPGRTRCPACGAATTDPWPSEDELDDAYAGWYRPRSGRFAGVGEPILRFGRGRLAGRLDRQAPPGPILDVGAGDGTLIDALSARGREAVGLERGSDRSDIRPADLAEIEGEWAAVVFWHSLEHLRAPGAALAHAARLLAPHGLLVVALPNSDSLQAQAFGDRWFALDLPRHLLHLPAGTLLTTITELGLRVERVSYLRGGQVVFGWLQGMVGSLPGRPDLYDAIRRPEARRNQIGAGGRIATLAAATLLMPLAAGAAATEVMLRRGGTVYVEARRG